MGSRIRWVRLLAAPVLIAGAVTVPAPASADLPALLGTCAIKDALDDNPGNGSELTFALCDDGVPNVGGTTPNVGAINAVSVPAAYTGPGAGEVDLASLLVPGGDPAGDIALDADLSVPDPDRHPVPAGGYPLVVMMHGCCSGSKTTWEGKTIDPGGSENWHYNNAWFASRGYVVLTYTSRGFVNGQDQGSTGETQLDSNRFEINDFQHLAGQIADTADLNPAPRRPRRSIPGVWSPRGLLRRRLLLDGAHRPHLEEPGRQGHEGGGRGHQVRLDQPGRVARAQRRRPARRPSAHRPGPGRHPGRLPQAHDRGRAVRRGHDRRPPGRPPHHLSPDIAQAILCLESADPNEQNPLCTTTLATTLPRFIEERSAYYQNAFFAGLASFNIAPVPVFSAGTFTDKLFPAPEHRRMVERLKATVPGYPVQEHYGDYNHFVQNKRKEWADLCGADRHVCRYEDYSTGTPSRDLNTAPPSVAREPGVTSRLNRFIDHYAKPQGNPGEPQPAFDVTGALQVCPQNGPGLGIPLDEPGPRFTASSYDALAPGRLTVTATGPQATTSFAGLNPHAKNADPVANQVANGSRCPVESAPGGLAGAGPGVATYDSDLLPADYTMLGSTRAVVAHTGTGPACSSTPASTTSSRTGPRCWWIAA